MNREHPSEGRGLLVKGLQDRLGRKWVPYFAAVLAMALVLPSLNAGFHLDDYFHRWSLDPRFDYEGEAGPLDIFRFLDGDPAKTRKWMDIGVLPWWSSPGLKASFWRPVAAITHWIDYQLWPSSAGFMHAQSILWFGVLILLVARFYRRVMSLAWVAGLAVLLYAVDDAHGNAVGWLANRNVLIAAVLGIVSILAHDRWRRDGWRIGCILGPLLFIISLLAKESAIATVAYLFSYAVFIDRGTRRSRLFSLAPYIVIALIWRFIWAYLGYGVAGMDLYTDPLSEPIHYIRLLPVRASILLLGQFGFPPADSFFLLGPESTWKFSAAAILFVCLLSILLTPLFRRDKVARFWGLGMILSLLPATATVPSDRLLFFVGIGAMGLLAQLIHLLLSSESVLPQKHLQPVWSRGVLVIVAVVHLLIPLVLLPLRAGNPLGSKEMLNRLYVRNQFETSIKDRDLIIVNAPSFFHVAYLGSMRITSGQPAPKRLRVLSTGFAAVDLYRSDDRTVIVRLTKGFLNGMFDLLYRSESRPIRAGEIVALDGMTVEVIAVADDGRPAEVSFRFDVPLENESLLWLKYTNGRFVYMVPPAIGERVRLPANPSIFSL